MIIGDMEIRLRADIARLQRDMDSARQVVGNATAGMERAATAAKAALASIAAGFGAQQFASMIDEYQKFTAQLKLATVSQREYAIAYADVKRISTQSTQGLQETGVLYARIANGTRELGIAQKQVAAITETVNLSLLVSGATTSEAASAQLQLSQAFASGTLRGEEFNAVNEAAPRLMKALADGMGLPVGALKAMAGEGQITSKIMADVLPGALEKLREEAKEVQTISGAFTVLRNNVMEFVGVQANASGAVSGLVSAIGLLSNNLGLLAGVITTLAVSKLTTMLAGWGIETYKQVAANAALRTSTLAGAVASTEAAATISAAKLAEAQANVRTTATAANLANARVAELRSAVLAAEGAVALAVATNGLIPAQARAIALSEAHSIALAQQAVAGNAATVTAGAASAALSAQAAATGIAARAMGVLRGAMMFMGGPIGAIVTLLGLAATAWMVWGNKAKEATEQAAESFDEAQVRIIKGLDEQIDKNEKLLKLRNMGIGKSDAEKQLPFVNQLAAASERLSQINARTGEFVKKSNTDIEFARIAVLRDITELTEKMAKADKTGAAVAAQSVDERVKAFKKEYATKQEAMAAELKAIEDLKGKTGEYDEMVRRIRAKYADNGAARAIKQEATAYQNLITSIGEKTAANELELSGYDRLSDSQKMTIKLDEAIASGKNKLTPAHIAEARALISKVAAQEDAIEQGKFYREQTEAQAALTASSIQAAETEAERNEELARTFGMSRVAIEQMTLARLQEQLAQADTSKGYTAEIFQLEAVIDAKKRSIAAMAEVEKMETSHKAAEQAAEDWKRAGEEIERSLTDALLRGFESGKSFGKNTVDTLKNMFSTLVLRPVISAAVSPLANNLTNALGVAGPAAAPGGAGALSSMAGLASSASNLYGALTGGATLAGGLGTGFLGSMAGGLEGLVGASATRMGLTSTLGVNIGNSIASVVGPNVASGIASGLSGLAAAAPWVAGALAVYTVGKKAFGHGPKEFTGDQTLNGSLGASGFTGTMDAEWVKKGGWFRSDKNGVDHNPVGAEFAAGLTSAYDAIKTTSADFARVLGINADSMASRTQVIKIAMGKDEAANQQAIADFFTGVANTVAGELLPEVTKFQAQGEAASATLQRLAVNFAAVDQILAAMGTTSLTAFRAVGTESIEARERLLALAGGIDALATQTTFFNENFLSEAERVAIIQKPLQEGLAALGFASLTTADQYKEAVQQLVSSGALATEQGAKQYAGLLALGPQFKTVSDYLKSVGDAAAETARLAAEAAQQAEDAARQAADTARETARQAALDQASTLLAGVDSAFSMLQSVVDRQKAALQEEIAVRTKSVQTIQSLAQALRGSLDSMSPVGFAADDRRSAQSEIQRALAVAKASGVLPDADDLKGALSVLGQDSSSQFATQQDYLRDFYATRLGIEDLAGLTDDALSVEERGLRNLEDQVKQFDLMLEREQEQIDVLKGISVTGLSIQQALETLRGAIAAAGADPVNSATSAISDAYKSALGRAPDAAGLDFWKDRAAAGVSQDEIVKAIKDSPEAKVRDLYREILGRSADAGGVQFYVSQMNKGASLDQVQDALLASEEAKKLRVPGYATGGDHGGGWRIVGEEGPELEATGPARIFNAGQTRDLMSRLANPVDNSAALAVAIDRLTETAALQAAVIERQGAALEQIQRNTRRQADTLDRVTSGGEEMRTKEQTA